MTVKHDSKLKVVTASYRHGAADHDSKFYRHDSKFAAGMTVNRVGHVGRS